MQVVAGFLLFGTLTGLLMAIFFDNSGGAWDNAKKLIESQGQKGSEQHKVCVVLGLALLFFSLRALHRLL